MIVSTPVAAGGSFEATSVGRGADHHGGREGKPLRHHLWRDRKWENDTSASVSLWSRLRQVSWSTGVKCTLLKWLRSRFKHFKLEALITCRLPPVAPASLASPSREELQLSACHTESAKRWTSPHGNSLSQIRPAAASKRHRPRLSDVCIFVCSAWCPIRFDTRAMWRMRPRSSSWRTVFCWKRSRRYKLCEQTDQIKKNKILLCLLSLV